ncbi:MAG: putative metal-binding motif-containing protein [Myxococcota bacterium]
MCAVVACGDGRGSIADLGVDAGSVCARGCDDGLFCNGEELCAPGARLADADGCVPGVPPCEESMACDEGSRTCRACVDEDGDGHADLACGGDDCDDADPNRFPGNSEVCDVADHDEDCDPRTFGFRDADGDGVADAACCNVEEGGERICGGDCDDASTLVGASFVEACDRVDNDCDGLTDEGVLRVFYEDADGDGFGAEGGMTQEGCTVTPGLSERAGDCDDTRPDVSPAARERCDAGALVDENCSGEANEGCLCEEGESRPCTALGVCAAGVEACDAETGTFAMSCSIAPVPETACDGADEDCDGAVDEGLLTLCYEDGDRDGFAADGAPAIAACFCPSGTTDREPRGADRDCDDTRRTAYPGAPEICNRLDDDCGDAANAVFEDFDDDGYAPVGIRSCSGGFPATDCNDQNALQNPGAGGFVEQPLSCTPGSRRCPCAGGPGFSCGRADSFCLLPAPACPTSFPTSFYDWDLDCSGTVEPSPPIPACSTLDDRVGRRAPLSVRTSAECGQAVPHRICGRSFALPLNLGCR